MSRGFCVEPTDSKLQDYYAILGVDSSASQESVKAAYRRLAREVHPDSKVRCTDQERFSFSVKMVQLNEAYGVLSDLKQRREYDQKLRLEGMLSVHAQGAVAEVKTGVRVTARQRTRQAPKAYVDVVVVEFGSHVRERLLAGGNKRFAWKDAKLEGFDWALESLFSLTHYCVALRGFAELDPSAVKRFTNYAEIGIAQGNRPIRKSYFLFLLPFEQVSEWPVISSQCQRLVSRGSNPKFSGVPVGILLLDMQHDRVLRFGASTKDKRFEQLIEAVGVSTT